MGWGGIPWYQVKKRGEDEDAKLETEISLLERNGAERGTEMPSSFIQLKGV